MGVGGRDGSVKFLLLSRRRGPLGGEGDPQVMDDLVYDRIVGDEGNYLHLGPAGRAGERISLMNLPNEFPLFPGNKSTGQGCICFPRCGECQGRPEPDHKRGRGLQQGT